MKVLAQAGLIVVGWIIRLILLPWYCRKMVFARDILAERYLHGDCHVFAWVAHDILDLPMERAWERREPLEHPDNSTSKCHMYVLWDELYDNTLIFDIMGRRKWHSMWRQFKQQQQQPPPRINAPTDVHLERISRDALARDLQPPHRIERLLLGWWIQLYMFTSR